MRSMRGLPPRPDAAGEDRERRKPDDPQRHDVDLEADVVMIPQKFPEHAATGEKQADRHEQQRKTAPQLAPAAEKTDEKRHERQRGEVQIAARHKHQEYQWQPLWRNPR